MMRSVVISSGSVASLLDLWWAICSFGVHGDVPGKKLVFIRSGQSAILE